MKKYKIVVVDCYAKNACCKEFSFKLSGNRASDLEFVLNHYAGLGWRFVQAVERNTASAPVYLYLEKDA